MKRGAIVVLAFALLTGHSLAFAQELPSARVRHVLAEPGFGWCHDPPRILSPEQRGQCGYVDARSACPEFAQRCDALAREAVPRGCAGNTAGIESAARVAVIVLLFALAAALIAWILRSAAHARRERAAFVRDEVSANAGASVPVIEPGTSLELLSRARDAATRGEYGPAVFALHGALVRRLDETGAIRIDPSSTSGDYVRACRDAALRKPLRDVSRAVERVRFGGAAPSVDLYERIIATVEPIVRGVPLLLVLSLFASTQLACRGAGSEPGSREDHGVSGHYAARAVLRSTGLDVRRMAGAPEDIADENHIVVVDTEVVTLERAQWRALLRWATNGGELIVAGAPSDLEREIGVREQAFAHVRNIALLDAAHGLRYVVTRPSTHALDVPASATVIARYADDDAVYGARIARGRGGVIVLAGSELLGNAGLAVGANADALDAIVHGAVGERHRVVEFVEDAEGAAGNPLATIARAGALPALLQGFALLVLVFIAHGRHFGTPRDAREESRRAFAEHVRAVGTLWSRARASSRALGSYGRFAIERLRERVGSSREGLAESIAARLGLSVAEVEATLTSYEQLQARDDSPRDRRTELARLRVASTLNAWLLELDR